jgi:hypothetical protein
MAPLPPLASPRVAISEIMYHPVLANPDDNDHEFLELFNPGTAPVAIGNWKLAGEVQFTFPAGTSIAPGQYLVVAKNRAKLLALPKYDLGPIAAQVLGDYTGALDDGGGRVGLYDAAGAAVDNVVYDDKFPWPLAADALGAGDGWFEENAWFPPGDPRKDLAAHRYLGHSLERVSMTVPGVEVSNWAPSPLDGATPGRASTLGGAAPAIVEELAVSPDGDPSSAVIRASDKVRLRARLGGGAVAKVEVEYYVDFQTARKMMPEAPLKAAMTAGPDGMQVVLPPLPERSVVRYRITGERKPGVREVISPRPTDPVPYGHHLYYVSPQVGGKPYYEILVAPDDWGRMWSNISPSGAVMGCPADYLETPCKGCMENPNWNARVPAIFAFGGEVHDVRVRYHGSMEGRTVATELSSWPAALPRPTTGPLKAMSWSVAFPRYRRFEGQSHLILNRLAQSCPGFSPVVNQALDEDERGGRVPAPHVRRFARLFVNGGAYNYVMDIESMGEEYLQRFHGPKQPVGDLFKLDSVGDDLGPWAAGFGQPLGASPFCPMIPVKTRYERTYSRETNQWRGHDELMALVKGLATARAGGTEALRAFLLKNFDVDATLKYYAVQQWGAPWDDNGKNYNLYKLPPTAAKPGAGAWTVTSWDVDRMFGVTLCKSTLDCARADISIYCGTGPMGEARLPRCNNWKTAFMNAMRAEYNAKLKELNETLFLPDNVKKLVDAALATYDPAEAKQMMAAPACNAVTEAGRMKMFAEKRYQAVKTQLGY